MLTTTRKTLDAEWATYERLLPQLATLRGKFVLIHEEQLCGIFDSERDAIRGGLQRSRAFLVHQIGAPMLQVTIPGALLCRS